MAGIIVASRVKINEINNLLQGLGFKVLPASVNDCDRLNNGVDFYLIETGSAAQINSVLRQAAAVAGESYKFAVINRQDLPQLDPRLIDDYFTFPLDSAQVNARLQFHIAKAKLRDSQQLILEGLKLNMDKYEVTIEDQPLQLTYKEFELLRFLMTNSGKVFSRQRILREIWQYDFYSGTRTVDVHIRRLRAKLGAKYGYNIQTVRNVGYRFGR